MLLVLAWVPLLVSVVVLSTVWIAHVWFDGGSARTLLALTAWFLIAAYLQFFGTSSPMTTTGLVLQAILAICLLIRLKFLSEGL